jgi:hypothetical protein
MLRTEIALHACCGPCSAAAVPALRAAGCEPVGFFFNPNIQPSLEWLRRLEAFEIYAAQAGLLWQFEPQYLPQRWASVVGSGDRPARCAACFRLRLSATADWALAEGFAEVTTTLLASPYQDREAILRVGREVAGERGLAFREDDYRPAFKEGQATARELGIYRQPYCGCWLSETERYEKRVQEAIARTAGLHRQR